MSAAFISAASDAAEASAEFQVASANLSAKQQVASQAQTRLASAEHQVAKLWQQIAGHRMAEDDGVILLMNFKDKVNDDTIEAAVWSRRSKSERSAGSAEASQRQAGWASLTLPRN